MQFVRHRRTGSVRVGHCWVDSATGTMERPTHGFLVGFLCANLRRTARLTLNNQGNGTSGHLAVMMVFSNLMVHFMILKGWSLKTVEDI